MEEPPGFEPGNDGFADQLVTEQELNTEAYVPAMTNDGETPGIMKDGRRCPDGVPSRLTASHPAAVRYPGRTRDCLILALQSFES